MSSSSEVHAKPEDPAERFDTLQEAAEAMVIGVVRVDRTRTWNVPDQDPINHRSTNQFFPPITLRAGGGGKNPTPIHFPSYPQHMPLVTAWSGRRARIR